MLPPTTRIGSKPYLQNKRTLVQSKTNWVKFTSVERPHTFISFDLFKNMHFMIALEVENGPRISSFGLPNSTLLAR